MSWRLVYGSEVGTSHFSTQTPCQDRCLAGVEMLSDGQPLLSFFISDGAGSALRGGEGAELAVNAAAALMTERLRQQAFELNDALAVDIVLAIKESIAAAASASSLTARDYACTFLGVLSMENGTFIMQIGDGGVAVDCGEGMQVPLVPMTGEYANMTWFVTDDDAVNVLATHFISSRARKVAAFTDGIQRLALNLADNTPHEPFFTPFFKVMASASPQQLAQLPNLLIKFLASPAVNQRTDDDKTLALALWMR
ncbi:PP2C family serine/threonine-protein phosphatase [Klebsiella aerogenes]|uniref:PP2C family serine/threonine-protein phosphatase n=1 Tax=Klebsiella aerogenes TaxID=548 RepID=UPI001BD5006E|nr:PP2C family serine/threonine-protein phosphatase [Klebsiella aerogenes]